MKWKLLSNEKKFLTETEYNRVSLEILVDTDENLTDLQNSIDAKIAIHTTSEEAIQILEAIIQKIRTETEEALK